MYNCFLYISHRQPRGSGSRGWGPPGKDGGPFRGRGPRRGRYSFV